MRGRGAIALLVVLFLVATACDQREPQSLRPRVPRESPRSTKTRLIGLVGTMSGPDAWRGDDAFEGAHLAVSTVNRALEPEEPAFELVTRDDRGDAETATALVEELAGSDRTVGIVYAGPVEGLPPAEDALAEAGIPALLTYGDLYTGRLLTPHIFQMGPAYLWQARVIARYLLLDRRYRRIGVLSEETLTGETARRAATTAFSELGGRVTASALFPRDQGEPVAALKALKRNRVQALVVDGSGARMEQTLRALSDMGSTYETTRLARRSGRQNPGAPGDVWAPQVIGFDPAMAPAIDPSLLTPGLAAADTYARGAHYLPIPTFERFRRAFVDWWDSEPLGWERRAFEAIEMIGWAARRVPTGKTTDVAGVLEKLRRKRFGGLDVTLGPDDHTAAEQTTVGLWVVPKPAAAVRERRTLPRSFPWVPLGRTFSIDAERTDILPEDWKYLFRNAPPKNRPAPKISRSLFGVTTGRRDPVH